MRNKKAKQIPSLRYALLSLQFNRGDAGIDFTLTVNDGELTDGFTEMDYHNHGIAFAKTSFLDETEKDHFARFCLAYLREIGKGAEK